MSSKTCAPDLLSRHGITFDQCRARRGGIFDWPVTSPHQDILNSDDEMDDDLGALHSSLRLGGTTVTTWLQVEKIESGQEYLSSHFGLAYRSALLEDLMNSAHIGSRSWDLDVGSQGAFPRQGSLVLGGYDTSAPNEGAVSYPLPKNPIDSSSRLLQTRIASMVLRSVGGTTDVELAHDLPACIEPYYRPLYLPEEIYREFMSMHESLRELLAELHFQNKLVADLIAEFFACYRTGRPLHSLAPDGSTTIDPEFTEIAIRREPTDRKIVTLGRVFLSQVYLFVDYETGKFALSSRLNHILPHTETPLAAAGLPRPDTTSPLSQNKMITIVRAPLSYK
ncbi:hypothetical protein B0H66DRAFT_593094 [Apodospora peruviana]|uniref:Uncharacterized protein n=1 Tax=Apodospora peruviana TaxID=516989 RepID=A0AAE0I2F8_9PEZI|nr:hypothetical protein B0H66DRAFT_593094 [Apodospora peruviana]